MALPEKEGEAAFRLLADFHKRIQAATLVIRTRGLRGNTQLAELYKWCGLSASSVEFWKKQYDAALTLTAQDQAEARLMKEVLILQSYMGRIEAIIRSEDVAQF